MPRNREAERRTSRTSTRSALRASMIAIEQESKRLAKGKFRSDEMVKKGKLPEVDTEMQTFIRDNLKGVLGHLGKIAGAVVNRGEEMKKMEEEGLGYADVLKVEHPEKRRLRAHSVSPIGSPKALTDPET